MKELMVLHECQVYLEIAPGTTRNGPELRIVLTAVSNGPGSVLAAVEEAVAVSYPNGYSKSMEGTVYRLCNQLDAALLAKWWKQGKLDLP